MPHCFASVSAGSFAIVMLAITLALAIGCGGGLPALQPPDVDPAEAAKQAIALYDQDGNAVLAADELEACPGLKLMLDAYDTDSDTAISQAEIQDRLQKYVDSGAALVPLSVNLRLNNRPLNGATVKLVPEPYFEGAIKPATGITAKSGAAQISVAADDLPENQKSFKAVQFGTYRVEITHPEIEIPKKYNTETSLGYETVFGQPIVEFRLINKKAKRK